MKNLLSISVLLVFSCSDEKSTYIEKEHEVIRRDIESNYQQNQSLFQSLTSQVASFKILRSIQFKYGYLGKGGINVYYDSIDMDSTGESFVINDLNDKQFGKILQQEGISVTVIENIKKQLDQLHCNSFFTLRTVNNSGSHYMQTEFKYNDWNGANFYFYKLFDKKLEPDMVQFFDRREVQMGTLKGIGGVLDSNAVWYLPYD